MSTPLRLPVVVSEEYEFRTVLWWAPFETEEELIEWWKSCDTKDLTKYFFGVHNLPGGPESIAECYSDFDAAKVIENSLTGVKKIEYNDSMELWYKLAEMPEEEGFFFLHVHENPDSWLGRTPWISRTGDRVNGKNTWHHKSSCTWKEEAASDNGCCGNCKQGDIK